MDKLERMQELIVLERQEHALRIAKLNVDDVFHRQLEEIERKRKELEND